MYLWEQHWLYIIWLVALACFAVINAKALLSGPKTLLTGTKSQEGRGKLITKLWLIVPFVYIAAISTAATFIPPVPAASPGFAPPADPHETGRLIWAAILVLGPPLYFFAEAVWIYGDGHGSDEQYKATQDLASKIWIAVSTVLGLYWFHNKLG